MHVRGVQLNNNPLHPKLFVYQQEKSSETTLYNFTRLIESTSGKMELAVCAFDNVSHTSFNYRIHFMQMDNKHVT